MIFYRAALAVSLAVCVVLPVSASAKEHRSLWVKHEFQLTHPCPSTGLTTGWCPGYVKDHIVPLACGGPDAVSNMQWQIIRAARAQDKWETTAALGRRELSPRRGARLQRSGARIGNRRAFCVDRGAGVSARIARRRRDWFAMWQGILKAGAACRQKTDGPQLDGLIS